MNIVILYGEIVSIRDKQKKEVEKTDVINMEIRDIHNNNYIVVYHGPIIDTIKNFYSVGNRVIVYGSLNQKNNKFYIRGENINLVSDNNHDKILKSKIDYSIEKVSQEDEVTEDYQRYVEEDEINKLKFEAFSFLSNKSIIFTRDINDKILEIKNKEDFDAIKNFIDTFENKFDISEVFNVEEVCQQIQENIQENIENSLSNTLLDEFKELLNEKFEENKNYYTTEFQKIEVSKAEKNISKNLNKNIEEPKQKVICELERNYFADEKNAFKLLSVIADASNDKDISEEDVEFFKNHIGPIRINLRYKE